MSKPSRQNRGQTDCAVKPIMPYLAVSPHRTSLVRSIRMLAGQAPDVMKGVNLHPLSMRKLRLIRHALREIIETRAASSLPQQTGDGSERTATAALEQQ